MLIRIYKKYKKIIFLLLKIIVLVLAYGFIYKKFGEINFSKMPLNGNYLYLIFAILLMPINWAVESIKWKILISKYEKLSFLTSFKAVFSGLTTSIFTPNRVGEFVGRILYVPDNKKAKAVVSTIIGSYSQFLITVLVGALAVFVINEDDINVLAEYSYIKYFFLIISIVLVTLFFTVGRLFNVVSKYVKNNSIIELIEVISSYKKSELVRVLSLSLLRYLIFFLQFYFLLQFFNIDISIYSTIGTVGLFYLFLLFIPTLSISEPSIRISMAITVFSYFVSDISLVIYTVSILWVINIAIPTIIGSVFFIGHKKKLN